MYEGSKNAIWMETLYQGEFVCSFKSIKLYPFDELDCTVKFFVSGPENAMVDFEPGELIILTEKSIQDFEIQSWTLNAGRMSDEGEKNGLLLTVHLGRNMRSILLVTYLPTLLINIVNQATNFITSSEKHESLIQVNITCMMVLASIYLSVSSSLPTTAATKPVEVWLLFNLAYPFMVILVNICLQVWH